MESKKTAIAIAHGHTAKWLQVVIHSLKKNLGSESIPFDIFVAATWPGHASLKAITETPLGENVTIHECVSRLHSHATGLDEILDLIRDQDYEYMFACETDCAAMKPGWLDWYHSFFTDEGVGMAGFFWHEGNNHYNINPSATLYRKKMLLQYHDEVRANMENMFYHPRGNKHGNDGGMDPTIKDVAGVFSETRGIKNPTPEQEEGIMKGVPFAPCFEPGHWLWCRSLGEWGGVAVPCDHIYQKWGGRWDAPEGTYYGGKADPQFIHYWGGTRAWDHLKHPVNDAFVKESSPEWLDREHRIWEETVPAEYRSIVPEIYAELGLEGMGYNKG